MNYNCKHYRKHKNQGYLFCTRDGSVRKENYCRNCPKFRYEPTKKDKIKLIFKNLKHLILGI